MTRTEKYRELTETCLNRMNDTDREIYRPILECALELGYAPKVLVKANDDDGELSFSKSKLGRTLLRILPMNNQTFENYPALVEGRAQMRLVFFAYPTFSKPFADGIKAVIEAFGGKYTGCYGCGRCTGKRQGYIYEYPDGKKVFRCGRELIPLPPLAAENVPEAIAMLKAQDEFWENSIK